LRWGEGVKIVSHGKKDRKKREIEKSERRSKRKMNSILSSSIKTKQIQL
jgi:hypothetical protein